MKTLSQAVLKELISYNPTTGDFMWLERPLKYFNSQGRADRWNKIYAGTKAGSLTSGSGRMKYVRIDVLGHKYHAHRLAYLYMTGVFPELQIDHINRDSSDNSWFNLRMVSKQGNARNKSLRKNNTSGFNGVRFQKNMGKWVCWIRHNGKDIILGYFENKDDAIEVRKEANLQYGYHPNHGVPIKQPSQERRQ